MNILYDDMIFGAIYRIKIGASSSRFNMGNTQRMKRELLFNTVYYGSTINSPLIVGR